MSGLAFQPAITQAALDAALASVSPLGPFTVATLPTPGPAILNRVATVSDLFGNRKSRVRCDAVGDFHFWQPLSSDSFGDIAVAANMTLLPLSSPTTISLSGAVNAGVSRSVTLGTAGGWPGAVKEIRSDMTLGLGSGLNILGTGLGSGLSLLLGGYRKFGLDYAGGVLTWKLLT